MSKEIGPKLIKGPFSDTKVAQNVRVYAPQVPLVMYYQAQRLNVSLYIRFCNSVPCCIGQPHKNIVALITRKVLCYVDQPRRNIVALITRKTFNLIIVALPLAK